MMADILVCECMRSPTIAIRSEATLGDAISLLEKTKQRHFAVVNDKQQLMGVITEVDIKYACPSPATSLNQWEMQYLVRKVRVEHIMKRDVTGIREDVTARDAAKTMAMTGISGLPVIDDSNRVKGMVTLLDILIAQLDGPFRTTDGKLE